MHRHIVMILWLQIITNIIHYGMESLKKHRYQWNFIHSDDTRLISLQRDAAKEMSVLSKIGTSLKSDSKIREQLHMSGQDAMLFLDTSGIASGFCMVKFVQYPNYNELQIPILYIKKELRGFKTTRIFLQNLLQIINNPSQFGYAEDTIDKITFEAMTNDTYLTKLYSKLTHDTEQIKHTTRYSLDVKNPSTMKKLYVLAGIPFNI